MSKNSGLFILKKKLGGKEVTGKEVFEALTKQFKKCIGISIVSNIIIDENNFSRYYNFFLMGGEKPDASSQLNSENIVEYKNNYNSILGNCFRSLISIIDYVDGLNIEDSKKQNYVSFFRSQLSIHEQIMIFYNWLTKGNNINWEYKSDDKEGFFTKYKLIQNICIEEMIECDYIYEKINHLIRKYNDLNVDKNPLFDFQRGIKEFTLSLPSEPGNFLAIAD
jgi:hypothetical protein